MEQRTDALSRLFDAHRAVRPSRRDLLTGAAALGVLLAGSSLLPGLARAQERPQGTPKKGGTLKVAVPATTVIDPPRLNSSAAIAIVQQAAEYLVYAEPDLRLRPVLATAWTPSQGNRVWTFTLRTGVRFHDGRPFTADDVVATFRRLLDPATASPAAAALSFLKKEGVEKIDDHTVRFTLDR